MNVEHRTSNFEQLRKHVLEIIGVVWLVVVAVQYVGRYYFGADIDLKFVYVGMLAVTIAAVLFRRAERE